MKSCQMWHQILLCQYFIPIQVVNFDIINFNDMAFFWA